VITAAKRQSSIDDVFRGMNLGPRPDLCRGRSLLLHGGRPTERGFCPSPGQRAASRPEPLGCRGGYVLTQTQMFGGYRTGRALIILVCGWVFRLGPGTAGPVRLRKMLAYRAATHGVGVPYDRDTRFGKAVHVRSHRVDPLGLSGSARRGPVARLLRAPFARGSGAVIDRAAQPVALAGATAIWAAHGSSRLQSTEQTSQAARPRSPLLTALVCHHRDKAQQLLVCWCLCRVSVVPRRAAHEWGLKLAGQA